MSNYIICTDSACDLKPETLSEWNVPSVELTFHFEGEDKEYTSLDVTTTDFYNRMREGGISKTAAINPDTFEHFFEGFLQKGLDVLYLCFSSGLSTTYNSARIAAEELTERYPDRKILVVDGLAASAGQGLLVYLLCKEKEEGLSLEEAASYAEDTKLHICHWFTVDDLEYLKRGGRISPTTAFVGNVLNIKPVLHVDNEGHLVSVSKAHGRKSALKTLVDKYSELAAGLTDNTIFISHADCIDDVHYVEKLIQERYGMSVEIVTDIGPVIGSHAGPGTLALFFVGTSR